MTPTGYGIWRTCDRAIGALLGVMIVLSVWAFGSSPPTVVTALNALGCVVGAGALLKRFLPGPIRDEASFPGSVLPRRLLGFSLGLLTLVLLAWCLISVLNARAEVDLEALRLVEEPGTIAWLPHSYDQPSSWSAFWRFLGLAGLFWAVRDWIASGELDAKGRLGEWSVPPQDAFWEDASEGGQGRQFALAPRLRLLCLILAGNGAAVALVGILSLSENPSKILWLLPHETRSSGFFGPFWYRNHAAAYLNLTWPFCLALALGYQPAVLRSARPLVGLFNTPVPILLAAAGVMVASIFASGSRGGMVIAVAQSACIVIACLFLSRRWRTQLTAVLFTVGALLVGVSWLTWDTIERRFFHDFFCYPTGVEIPLEEFSLRCQVVVPDKVDDQGDFLAGFCDRSTGLWNTPSSVGLLLLPNGSVGVRFNRDQGRATHLLRGEDPQLNRVGERVKIELSFTRGTIGLSVDGTQLALVNSGREPETSLPRSVRADFLWVGRATRGLNKAYSHFFDGEIDLVSLYTPRIAARSLMESDDVGQSQEGRSRADSSVVYPRDESARPILEVHPRAFSPRQWFLAGLSGRQRFYGAIASMLPRYPAWSGSGPGTFAPLFKVHVQDEEWTDEWAAHDDFLQTRVTFGWLGMGLILAVILLSVLGATIPGRVMAPVSFGLICLMALGGALLHARFDWIFQNHALLLHGAILCGALSSVRCRSAAGALTG